jgi:hypothetical protein
MPDDPRLLSAERLAEIRAKEWQFGVRDDERTSANTLTLVNWIALPAPSYRALLAHIDAQAERIRELEVELTHAEMEWD